MRISTKKGQLRVASPDPEERAAAAQIEGNESEYGGGAARFAIRAPGEGIQPPPKTTKTHSIPRNHRELALAIFTACNPTALGCDVIEQSNNRGASTKLRALEMFADWAYGKPPTPERSERVCIIWDIPLPAHKRVNQDPMRSEGDDK